MSEGLNPVYKLALGAVWTSGRDLPNYTGGKADRLELLDLCGGPRPSDFAQYLRDGGAREAARALGCMGLPLSDIGQAFATSPDAGGALGSANRGKDCLRMLEPLELASDHKPGPLPGPTAGDIVELGQPWQELERVTLQGHRGTYRRGLTCANPGGGWHYNRSSDLLSMGNGGPASILYLDLRGAVDTGERALQRVWSFESVPRAHTGVDWLLSVPVWRIEGPAAFIDYEEAERALVAA